MKHQSIKINNCPVCESSDLADYLHSQDHFLSKESFTITSCNDCGFLFTNPRPDEEALPRYYESEAYISHSNVKKGLISSLYQSVRKYTLRKKVGLLTSYIKTGHALDIGCGTGEFLKSLSKSKFEVTGIEPNEGARNFARNNYGLEVHDENHLRKFANESFNVITMWHVLEHVSNLNERISMIKGLLKKSGILIVAVPNPESFDAEFYHAHWAAWDLPRHLYHFKKQDIFSLFKKVDMEIVKIHPMVFDSFYVSLLSEKYKTGSANLIRPFFVGLISNLKAVLHTKNYSSQIYVIRHKNS